MTRRATSSPLRTAAAPLALVATLCPLPGAWAVANCSSLAAGACAAGYGLNATAVAAQSNCAAATCDVNLSNSADLLTCCSLNSCTGGFATAPFAHTTNTFPSTLRTNTDVQGYLTCNSNYYRSDAGAVTVVCDTAGSYTPRLVGSYTCTLVRDYCSTLDPARSPAKGCGDVPTAGANLYRYNPSASNVLCVGKPCDMSAGSQDLQACCTKDCLFQLPTNDPGPYDQLHPQGSAAVTSYKNVSWGNCPNTGGVGQLPQGGSCSLECEAGTFNLTHALTVCGANGSATVQACVYAPPGAGQWTDAGHWVVYDAEDTQVDDREGNKLVNAAGVNITLRLKYTDLEQQYLSARAFGQELEVELGELLRVSYSRVRVVHVTDAQKVSQQGLIAAQLWRTKVEFLVTNVDPENTGELDATQTVDQFIEYYYDTGSPLYKYSHKLPLLRQIDGEVGIEVIVTCGQDPCHPKMTGFIAWLVAGTFIFSAALTACVIMTYGRGALGWMLK